MTKLFNVVVPRFKGFQNSYTSEYFLPTKYPENAQQVVIEIKGMLNRRFSALFQVLIMVN